jgi:hypothetical protein
MMHTCTPQVEGGEAEALVEEAWAALEEAGFGEPAKRRLHECAASGGKLQEHSHDEEKPEWTNPVDVTDWYGKSTQCLGYDPREGKKNGCGRQALSLHGGHYYIGLDTCQVQREPRLGAQGSPVHRQHYRWGQEYILVRDHGLHST